MTGGPKAERVRRVTSASDGPVEVGWVQEHSAPTVKDRPLVMLQTLSQRDGRPLFRLTFDEAEARELFDSLAYVLGLRVVVAPEPSIEPQPRKREAVTPECLLCGKPLEPTDVDGRYCVDAMGCHARAVAIHGAMNTKVPRR